MNKEKIKEYWLDIVNGKNINLQYLYELCVYCLNYENKTITLNELQLFLRLNLINNIINSLSDIIKKHKIFTINKIYDKNNRLLYIY